MALTKNQNKLSELLLKYNLKKDDFKGIFFILENTTKDYIGMIKFLENNQNLTRDDIFYKCFELSGIEPLSDEDFENLNEDDYILEDDTAQDIRDRGGK